MDQQDFQAATEGDFGHFGGGEGDHSFQVHDDDNGGSQQHHNVYDGEECDDDDEPGSSSMMFGSNAFGFGSNNNNNDHHDDHQQQPPSDFGAGDTDFSNVPDFTSGWGEPSSEPKSAPSTSLASSLDKDKKNSMAFSNHSQDSNAMFSTSTDFFGGANNTAAPPKKRGGKRKDSKALPDQEEEGGSNQEEESEVENEDTADVFASDAFAASFDNNAASFDNNASSFDTSNKDADPFAKSAHSIASNNPFVGKVTSTYDDAEEEEDEESDPGSFLGTSQTDLEGLDELDELDAASNDEQSLLDDIDEGSPLAKAKPPLQDKALPPTDLTPPSSPKVLPTDLTPTSSPKDGAAPNATTGSSAKLDFHHSDHDKEDEDTTIDGSAYDGAAGGAGGGALPLPSDNEGDGNDGAGAAPVKPPSDHEREKSADGGDTDKKKSSSKKPSKTSKKSKKDKKSKDKKSKKDKKKSRKGGSKKYSELDDPASDEEEEMIKIASKSELPEAATGVNDENGENNNNGKSKSGKSSSSAKKKKKESSSKSGSGSGKKSKSKSGNKSESSLMSGTDPALLNLVSHIDEAMRTMEKISPSTAESSNNKQNGGEEEPDCKSLLNGFEALVGILVQHSDDLEALSTSSSKDSSKLSKKDKGVVLENLKAVLGFCGPLDNAFVKLVPVLKHYLVQPVDEELGDLFYGMNLMVDLLCELSQRVAVDQKHKRRHRSVEWNAHATTSYTTLLELLQRDSLEVLSIYDDVDTPPYKITAALEKAWKATNHEESFERLSTTHDLAVFRQICYQVIKSCSDGSSKKSSKKAKKGEKSSGKGNWCPNVDTLMDICGIEPEDEVKEDEEEEDEDEDEDDNVGELPPTPEAALQVLEKIHGDPIPRLSTLTSILRLVIPLKKIKADPKMAECLASLPARPAVPASNMVAISSVPEKGTNTTATAGDNNKEANPATPAALGVAGVGKSTLAAMVASHPAVQRHFSDGIAWIHIGQQKDELNYTRYVQCLKDVLAQLDIPDAEEPLFPELLQTPGEPISRSRRREEGFMMFVRESVADFLQDRKVLLILEDVGFDADLDWFDFGAPEEDDGGAQSGGCFVLFTSRRRDLLPPEDTIEVDVLQSEEAVQLLVQESGDLIQQESKGLKKNLQAVVRECANHPLAVKSVGRWLSLKHATANVGDEDGQEGEDGEDGHNNKNLKEEVRKDVVSSMEKILRSGSSDDADMMHEILDMSLSPAINGEPTTIIKFCFAAFVRVFCDKEFISDFALADASPIVPLMTAEVLFEALLNLEEENLRNEGSLFHENKQDAAALIPEALSQLGVLKVIETVPEDRPAQEGGGDANATVERYLQVTHNVQQDYGEYLLEDDISIKDYTMHAEKRWNKAFAEAYMTAAVAAAASNQGDGEGNPQPEWDTEEPNTGLDYALEMLPVHMIRGGLYADAINLLTDEAFVRGRLFALGRENGARRHIKDCETLFDVLQEKQHHHKGSRKQKHDPKAVIKDAYGVLGGLLDMDEDDFINEEGSPEAVEVGRCNFEIGFSLAEKRCWDAAIAHWETSQDLFVSSLGMVEVVAGVLFNVGVVFSQMRDHDQALESLKQCLRIRGAIHGEEHILYAQTIQKIGDVFWAMSDYQEAMESYKWALDVMHIEPNHHRIDIGDILEHRGVIHYSKGELDDSLKCYHDALRSKVADLGSNHHELASIYQNIGQSLADQGKKDEAAVNFNQAVRLRELDPHGGDERDADISMIQGLLLGLEEDKLQSSLESYEKGLYTLVTKVTHRKEKVAHLLHVIACVYHSAGEEKKALQLFEECLQARRKILGFVHLDVANTLFQMGSLLQESEDDSDKALKCLEEALKIRELRLPDSEMASLAHEKIGALARSIGKAKKAEIAFTEALRIRKLIHGDGHPAVATVLQDLGDLFDQLGDYNEASKYYREALKIRHSRLGPEDLAVAETFYSMGFTLMHQGALDKALECLEESLSIRKLKLGEKAEECGDTLNMMGFVQIKRNGLVAALALLDQALTIRKEVGENVKIAETLKNIGDVHRENEEYDDAEAVYEECLKVWEEELGEDEDDRVAEVYIAQGHVFGEMNRPTTAMDSYEHALAIRSRLHGDSDESVATVLQYMGTLEVKASRLDKAYQLLNECIKIRDDNDIEPDGDYVNVLFMIGNIYKMQGREEEAQRRWREAYKIFRDLGLAESNPEIAQVMDKLMRENQGMGGVDDDEDEDTSDHRNNNTSSHFQSAGSQEFPRQESTGSFGELSPVENGGGGGRSERKSGVFGRLRKSVQGGGSSGGGGGKPQKMRGQRL